MCAATARGSRSLLEFGIFPRGHALSAGPNITCATRFLRGQTLPAPRASCGAKHYLRHALPAGPNITCATRFLRGQTLPAPRASCGAKHYMRNGRAARPNTTCAAGFLPGHDSSLSAGFHFVAAFGIDVQGLCTALHDLRIDHHFFDAVQRWQFEHRIQQDGFQD